MSDTILAIDLGRYQSMACVYDRATRVSKESAPALVIHGDADKLVPIQQPELLVDKYKEAGVPFELVVKKGASHGWADMDKDVGLIADWFDKHLGVSK